jgi:hypothetical protein
MATKKEWGNATWYLFHTLSCKIKDEHFDELKDDLLNICSRICANLPCPDCSEHATTVMKNLNRKNIKTKKDLQMFFFDFHNSVNRRTKKSIYTEDDMCKYRNAITKNIVFNFISTMSKKYHNIRLLTNSFHRDTTMNDFKKWISHNCSKFYA